MLFSAPLPGLIRAGRFFKGDCTPMARWPDHSRANLIAMLLIFGLFPLLCWLTWWYVNR